MKAGDAEGRCEEGGSLDWGRWEGGDGREKFRARLVIWRWHTHMVAGVPRLSLVQQPGVEEEGQRRAVVREQHQVAAAAVGEIGAHLAARGEIGARSGRDRGEIGAGRTGSIGTD